MSFHRCRVPGRADAGLALSANLDTLLVACGGGEVFALCSASGHMTRQLTLGGAIKAAPRADPWQGLVWLATHGKELVALSARCPLDGDPLLPPGAYTRQAVTHPLPAPSSCAVVFDPTRKGAMFVACLDGSVVALRAGGAPARGRATAGQAGTDSDAPVQVSMLWTQSAGAPVFSTPAAAGDKLMVCNVLGAAMGLARSDGSVAWRRQLAGGNVFADIALAAAGVALIVTHSSHVYAINCDSGSLLWGVDIEAGPLSCPPCMLPAPHFLPAAPPAAQRFAICSDAGVVCSLDMQATGDAEKPYAHACRLARLAQPVFSAPVAIGSSIVFGCRDDCVHKVSL